MFIQEKAYTAEFTAIADIETEISEKDSVFFHTDELLLAQTILSPIARRCFLAGRYCIKKLWTAQNNEKFPFNQMNIVSKNAAGQGIQPKLFVNNKQVKQNISLSHSGFAVFAVLSEQPDDLVGCDIVPFGSITEKSFPFLFTKSELQFLKTTDFPYLADTFWAVKESAYKASFAGEPFSPLHWNVSPLTDSWFECSTLKVKTFAYQNHAAALKIRSNADS